jgi:hypothetical protein
MGAETSNRYVRSLPVVRLLLLFQVRYNWKSLNGLNNNNNNNNTLGNIPTPLASQALKSKLDKKMCESKYRFSCRIFSIY